MEEIIDVVSNFEGVLVVVPGEGSGSPELAWGDAFFYYAPGWGDAGADSAVPSVRSGRMGIGGEPVSLDVRAGYLVVERCS